ncbi:MAG: hypothetical protein WDN04_18320 [Rhodospirillales bacterium]
MACTGGTIIAGGFVSLVGGALAAIATGVCGWAGGAALARLIARVTWGSRGAGAWACAGRGASARGAGGGAYASMVGADGPLGLGATGGAGTTAGRGLRIDATETAFVAAAGRADGRMCDPSVRNARVWPCGVCEANVTRAHQAEPCTARQRHQYEAGSRGDCQAACRNRLQRGRRQRRGADRADEIIAHCHPDVALAVREPAGFMIGAAAGCSHDAP